jgi:DeoR/GlpR family transcriptional regulator of sugar metabolism
MEQQRRMMDIIRQRGQVSLEELAAELRVSIGTVTRLVEDLDSLDLFTGYIDWANSRIYAVQPQELPESNA